MNAGDLAGNGGAVRLELQVRPKVRRGDPLPTWIRYTHRGGSHTSIIGVAEWVGGSVNGIDLPIRYRTGVFDLTPNGSGSATLQSPDPDPDLTSRLDEGSARVNLAIEVYAKLGSSDREFLASPRIEDDHVGPKTIYLTQTIDVLPPDEHLELTYNDESVRRAVEQRVRVSEVHRWAAPDNYEHWFVSVTVDRPPVLIDWTIWIRTGSRDIDTGGRLRIEPSSAHRLASDRSLTDREAAAAFKQAALAGETVTLVLRPDPQRLVSFADSTPVLGGEIVIPNVPVSLDWRPSAKPRFAPAGADEK